VVTEYEEIGQSNDNAPGCLLAFDSFGKPSDQPRLRSAVTVWDSNRRRGSVL